MIPEAKQPAVARALADAFGVREFDEIRPLTGGMSAALVFRIVVRRHPYVLRLSIGPDLAAPDAKVRYRRLHLAAAQRDVLTPRFETALARVASVPR